MKLLLGPQYCLPVWSAAVCVSQTVVNPAQRHKVSCDSVPCRMTAKLTMVVFEAISGE